MKKVIIAVVSMAIAVVANASSFKWTAGNIYGSDATTKFTGTVAIMAYTTDVGSAVKVADAYVVAGTLKSDAQGTATGFTYSWDDAVGGTTYNFYMIIEDGGNQISTATSNPTKIVSAVAQATSTPTVAFGSMATVTQSSDNWGTVPEPTSALLMVLGVAGLALRRRRV